MSENKFMVATMRKFKQENLGGIEIHNERKTKNHSNDDIDVSKKARKYTSLLRKYLERNC